MKIFVYGTLKNGRGNHVLLSKTKFIGEHVLPGYMLYDAGFPVAAPSPEHSIRGEVYEIHPEDELTLRYLDRLEAEGRMYNRTEQDGLHFYVGNPDYWRNFRGMDPVKTNDQGHFEF